MTSKPSLTVVVTCYNRERYLGTSVESVLKSRFTDFELLVLDDASTDGSVELARAYARDDDRIRVVANETNLGDYRNRNRALELVETPLLKYHDSDDVMYPHCLDTMVEALRDTPTAGFAMSAGRSWSGGPCPMVLTPRLAYLREYLGGGLFHCGPSGALFRTAVLRELGGFPERGAASDFVFWVRACAVTPVVLVPADLFWYRVHPGQEIASEGSLRAYASADGEAWRALLSERCPLAGEELRRAKRSCTRRLLRQTWHDLRDGKWSLIATRLRSSGIRPGDFMRYPPKRDFDPNAGSPSVS